MITIQFSISEDDTRLPLFFGALYSQEASPPTPTPPEAAPSKPGRIEVRVQPEVGATAPLWDESGQNKIGLLTEADGWVEVLETRAFPAQGPSARLAGGWVRLHRVEMREI